MNIISHFMLDNILFYYPKKSNVSDNFIDNFSGLDNNEELLYTKNNIENLTKQYLESFVREIAEGKNFIVILNLCLQLNGTGLLTMKINFTNIIIKLVKYIYILL